MTSGAEIAMHLGKNVRVALRLGWVYLAAWLLSFLLIVGFSLELAPRYFALGWTFTGLELPTLVWLLAWPLFGAFLLAYHFIGRARRESRGSTA